MTASRRGRRDSERIGASGAIKVISEALSTWLVGCVAEGRRAATSEWVGEMRWTRRSKERVSVESAKLDVQRAGITAVRPAEDQRKMGEGRRSGHDPPLKPPSR